MATGRVSTNIELGPGTLYAAAVGATEPVSASAALPSATFNQVGYTEDGSTFGFAPKTSEVLVEEEFDPIRIVTTGRAGKLSAKLAEITRRNLMLSLNQGAGGAETPQSVEPPAPGAEIRVMLIWDSDPQGPSATNSRWIFRQCFQTGDMKIDRKKAPAKSLLQVDFELEKPTGLQLFKVFPNADSLV